MIDNNSPNIPNLLKNDKRIKYIQSKTNLGFGKANNLGAQYASGKYLFLLNPDTILINNAIAILYNYNENNSTVGICGGNLYTKDLRPCHSYRVVAPGILDEINDLFKGLPLKLFSEDHFNSSNKSKQVAYITGADLLISKKLFTKINSFDNDFFMYFEETHLCYKVSKLGMKIINILQARIIHLEGQSFSHFKEKREILYLKSRNLYLKKRYSSLYIQVCNMISKFNCIVNIAYFSVISKKKIAYIWKFRLNQLNELRK